MYLSRKAIYRAIRYGQLNISPLNHDNIQPVSIDLTLGNEFLVPAKDQYVSIANPNSWKNADYDRVTGTYELHPHEFVLATTEETIELRSFSRAEHSEAEDVWGQIHGKSTFGRLGLLVHVTAGVIDPGYMGKITLELANVGPYVITLVPGIPICQMTFATCEIVDTPYGSGESKYQRQEGTTWPR